MGEWAVNLKVKMMTNGILTKDIAKHLGCSVQYVSMVFHGKEKPKDAEEKFNTAVDEIIRNRKNEVN